MAMTTKKEKGLPKVMFERQLRFSPGTTLAEHGNTSTHEQPLGYELDA